MNRDAAIEAGARVSFESRTGYSWDEQSNRVRAVWRKEVAYILDAAAPHLVGEPVVLDFIEQRVEYVRALRQFRGSSRDADYWRWQGHAEARRQLAERLGVKVPYEPRDRRTVVVPVEDQP